MISGMIGYKWAVKGSKWGAAAIFGIIVMLVNGLIGYVVSLMNINLGLLGLLTIGLSAFLVAMYYKKISQKTSINIAFKTVIVSVIIGLLLLALVGLMFISLFGGIITL